MVSFSVHRKCVRRVQPNKTVSCTPRFLKDKQSPPYVAFRNMVNKFRNELNAPESNSKEMAVENSPATRDSQDTSNIPADDGIYWN